MKFIRMRWRANGKVLSARKIEAPVASTFKSDVMVPVWTDDLGVNVARPITYFFNSFEFGVVHLFFIDIVTDTP